MSDFSYSFNLFNQIFETIKHHIYNNTLDQVHSTPFLIFLIFMSLIYIMDEQHEARLVFLCGLLKFCSFTKIFGKKLIFSNFQFKITDQGFSIEYSDRNIQGKKWTINWIVNICLQFRKNQSYSGYLSHYMFSKHAKMEEKDPFHLFLEHLCVTNIMIEDCEYINSLTCKYIFPFNIQYCIILWIYK